jgi:uncharacterized protein (TIGR03382 family)
MAGMWGNQRVGDVAGRATLWDGTSPISLQPLGVGSTYAYSIRDSEQAGSAYPSGLPERAVVWHGTAESMVYLHPTGNVYSSEAIATDGSHQGGWVRYGTFPNIGLYHAAMWSGSSATFQDLQPSEVQESYITGMAPGQQVGWTSTPDLGRQAAVWSGSAASWQNFGVPGMGTSELLATTGTEQVGAVHPGLPKAAIWFNSAASYLDLHQFLPPAFYDSTATCVYRDGTTIYVGGWAHIGSHNEAILWTGTIPAPGALPLLAAAALAGLRRRRGDRAGDPKPVTP